MAEKRQAKTVTGVVQIFVNEEGYVIAHAADFNSSAYGGFTLIESQRLRVRDALALNVVNAYSSPGLVRGFDEGDARRVIARLVEKCGCRIHEVVVGGEAK